MIRLASVVVLVAACSGPILANPTLPPSVTARATPGPSLPADPQPIALPRDDGPHARLTEWWYYTGHLRSADGRRFGFEAVVFRAERGALPVTWASHLALTDEAGGRFLYSQRSEVGAAADRSPRGPDGVPTGFALAITGFDPAVPESLTRDPWILAGSGGRDAIRTVLSPGEAATAGSGFGLDLELAAEKPPALHGGIGWVDFLDAGSSYYYSRTRMAAIGTLTLDGETIGVEGTAWFDHQWGDFISVGGGGWDWFAVNLADGTDLTVSLVRDSGGAYTLAYGTLVDRDGRTSHLAGDAVVVGPDPARTWRSPATSAVYPAGWTILVPREGLVIDLEPTLPDQELDTRPTTGVVYWEGSQVVRATRNGIPVAGEAYVELTGYAPAGP
ncbi:MAG TPA: lipocalin-like domain-containing protein [Candidatus Sulfomarinibacteraceae bacterium]|nr:lipocalin-like domain-containing protein [Candidatus Sulfomarinibacteraceae bacterium]